MLSIHPNPPPPHLLPWLIHRESLTQKLIDVAGDAQMEVVNQQWEAPNQWDQQVLQCKTASVMHREIIMRSANHACWYARTILPDTTYQTNIALFDRLKKERLGNLIFNGTEIQRASLIHFMISPTSQEYTWLTPSLHQNASELWVRLSEFIVNKQHSFFLIEILLPGLMRYLS